MRTKRAVWLASVFAAVAFACSSASTDGPGKDDGGTTPDAASGGDSSNEDVTVGSDTGVVDSASPTDSGFDAKKDVSLDVVVDAHVALCKKYADTQFDGSAKTRYTDIGERVRALAEADCHINALFLPSGTLPLRASCLTWQIKAAVECTKTSGAPYVYDLTAYDSNGTPCRGKADGSGSKIFLGFRDPLDGTVTQTDIELVIQYVVKALKEYGYDDSEAQSVGALLLADKAGALSSAAPGYSNDQCPP